MARAAAPARAALALAALALLAGTRWCHLWR
jgi:hypothetical protein